MTWSLFLYSSHESTIPFFENNSSNKITTGFLENLTKCYCYSIVIAIARVTIECLT